MSSLILTVGLPRSGKTTWALQWWRATGAPIVSPDAIRLALHGQRFQALAEPFVWAIAKVMARALFAAGHPTVIVDATNTTRKRRDDWRDPAWTVSFYELGTSAGDCRMRARAMGDEEIIATIDRMEAAFEPITDEERGSVGAGIVAEPQVESKVIDLMAALKASLDGICVVCAGTGRADRQPVSAGGSLTPAMIDAAWKVVAQWEVRSADDQYGGYISTCDDCDGVGEDEHPETIAHAPTCVIGALRAALTAPEGTSA